MKCHICGAELKVGHENIKMVGLDNVVTVGAKVTTCPGCGERTVSMHRMAGLVEAVTRWIVTKPERLSAQEVRWLRGVLELEGTELANAFGSNKSTVSRWETGKQPMGRHSELLLRAMAMAKYGFAVDPRAFASIGTKPPSPDLVAFVVKDDQWTRVEGHEGTAIDLMAALKSSLQRGKPPQTPKQRARHSQRSRAS